MKKYSQLNDIKNTTNKTSITSDNTIDFIKNIVNETLSIKDGNIIGKDLLIDTLVEMYSINKNKTILSTLETVKIKSYKQLNMNWINESINEQRNIINGVKPIVVETNNDLNANMKIDKTTLINESNIVDEKNKEKCDCDNDNLPDELKEIDVQEEQKEEIEITESNHDIWKTVNWLDRSKIQEYLEDAGYAVYDNESTEELKSVLVQAIEDGEVILNENNKSLVSKVKYVNDNDYNELNSLNSLYESILNENVNHTQELSFKLFKELYLVENNKFDKNNGILYNYYGEQLDYVESKIFENKVASLIEENGNILLVNGFNTKNIKGFIITNNVIESPIKINMKR